MSETDQEPLMVGKCMVPDCTCKCFNFFVGDDPNICDCEHLDSQHDREPLTWNLVMGVDFAADCPEEFKTNVLTILARERKTP